MSRVGSVSSPRLSFKHSTTVSILLFAFAATSVALAQEEVLYRFKGGTDGYHPSATLLKDNAGNLYGTTVEGGKPWLCDQLGCGTVFELTRPANAGDPWTETVLYRFKGSDGAYPGAALVADRQGNLYSTTAAGGAYNQGTVFELERPGTSSGTWTYHVLYSFAGVPSGSGNGDGSLPSGVVLDAAGNLYGTTDWGGFCVTEDSITTCFGSVFRLAPPSYPGGAWTESILHRFYGNGLSGPHGSVIFDGQGNLYGTTYLGGSSPYYLGGVFKLSPPAGGEGEWPGSILFEFGLTDGGAPNGSLIFDSAGNLYGTTLIGGTSGYGTAFELSPPASGHGEWSETILHNFLTNGDGNSPLAELIFDKQGNLYGTDWWGGEFGEYNAGTVFRLSPSSGGEWTETTLHNFGSGDDGSDPTGGLIFGPDGALYGTASQGGGPNTDHCILDGYAWTCGMVFRVKP